MKKGDTVEGTFRGASATELSIEVAGQQLRIPLGDIRYLSFVGRLDSAGPAVSATPGTSATGSIDDAFAALDELDGAVRIGVLRAQYSEKIVATLPRVLAFVDANEADNPDLSSVLREAVRFYKMPMEEISKYYNPWEQAPSAWGIAGRYVDYAKQLAKNPRPPEEDTATRELVLGQPMKGRLRHGDKVVPPGIDKDSAGYLADVFRLKLDSETKLSFRMTAIPCPGTILVLDGTGKKIADKAVELKKTLKAGVYEVWAACRTAGDFDFQASVER
jgi:hypothetical protein